MTPEKKFAYAMGSYENLHSYTSSWYEFGDTQTQWQQNCAIRLNYWRLERQGWLDPECILYDVNEYGFRSTDLTAAMDLAVFGDSYTFGVGLPNHCLWHHILGERNNWRRANFGVAGAAPRTCFRLARYWLPVIQPRFAIFVMPQATRLEVATQIGDGCMTTPYLVSDSIQDGFLQRWWMTDFNSEQERDIIQQALINICRDLDIRFLFFTTEFFEKNFYDVLDTARDLQHGGRRFQQQVADYIQEHLNCEQWH